MEYPALAFQVTSYYPIPADSKFPKLPKFAHPALQYETDQYIFMLAFSERDVLIFAWDKISISYNSYQYFPRRNSY